MSDFSTSEQYNFYPSVHLTVLIGVVRNDGISLSTTVNLNPSGSDATVDHRLSYLFASSFGEDLVRAVGTDIIRVTYDAYPLVRTSGEELV